MTAPDFERALREEEARRTRMPADARARVRKRLLRGAPEGKGRMLPWLLAGVAAAGALMLVLFLRPPHELGGFSVLERSAGLATRLGPGGELEVREGTLTVLDRAQALTLELTRASSIERADGGVRVRRGTVRISARHREKTQLPAVVLVSGGQIEVMGTHFVIEQAEGSGTVTLRDGAIQFRALDGRTVSVAPGESLRWPLPAPMKAPEPAPAPVPEPVPARFAPAEALLEEVEILRSRQAFERAAHKLAGVPSTWPAATRERLSFELFSLYTHQLHDRRRACWQWQHHTLEFPRGRYSVEMEREERALRCEQGRR